MASLAVVESVVGNVEAEVGVIAALLCHPATVDRIADRLSPEHFSEPFLGFVYGTIIREHSLGRSLNPVTIRPLIESEQGYADMGGMAWLAGLGNQPAVLIGASGFAEQIAEFAQRRRIMDGLREAIQMAADFEQPMESVIEAADDAISGARDAGASLGEHSGAECLKAVIDGFEVPVTGTECGNIRAIDRLLGPMRPGHLVIGAGRPGMGKTATAVSYALGAASQGHGVLFVSLEMGAEELGERMAGDLCLDHRIPYEKIRDRALTPEQQREICRAHDRLRQMPLQIVDRAGMSVAQLRTAVKRWARRFAARGHKLELVIVDYLQLMRADRKMGSYEAVSEISRSLKEVAKENGIAVLALAQLSRKVEERADKRPMLADLRDSGQIEQDADAVLFFLRDEYYLRNAEPPEGSERREAWEKALRNCTGKIDFICAKRRNGRTGSETGEFLYVYQAVRG